MKPDRFPLDTGKLTLKLGLPLKLRADSDACEEATIYEYFETYSQLGFGR